MVGVAEKLKHTVEGQEVHTLEVLASRKYFGGFSS